MNAFEWVQSASSTIPANNVYCPTSDVWQGRFSKIAPLLINKKFDPKMTALFASAIGEIGDNCFVHNAPAWIDIPGSWFEWTINNQEVTCTIADRGRGILASLQAVRPSLQTHKEALLAALTEKGLSGRAPEERGNGLKYVMDVLADLSSGSFVFETGDAQFFCSLPLDRERIHEYIKKTTSPIRGMYCKIIVSLPYAN